MQHISALSNVKVEKRVISERPRLLSLYAEPPQQELTLDEFEVVSLDRLQLLRSIDVLKTKGGTEGEANFNHQLYEVMVTMVRNSVIVLLILLSFFHLYSWKRNTC